jgi:hypothetical protein
MKDLESVLSEIADITLWWYDLKKGYTSISHLDDVHRKLTGLYFFLSELSAEAYRDYSMSYVSKKVGLSKQKAAIMESKRTAALADAKSILAMADVIRKEAEEEAIYNRCKLILSATAKIIEAIKQKISNLKSEKQNSNRQV